MRSFHSDTNLIEDESLEKNIEECRIGEEISCPQEAVHEHIGPYEFLLRVLLLFFSCFEVTFCASAFLLIYFSFFFLISNFFIFLISLHFICIRNIANFPPPLRFLSPLIMKKEVTSFAVSCCFCCWFRCFSNKFVRLVIVVLKYTNLEMKTLWILKM